MTGQETIVGQSEEAFLARQKRSTEKGLGQGARSYRAEPKRSTKDLDPGAREVILTFSWVPRSGLCQVSILIRKSSFMYSFCKRE